MLSTLVALHVLSAVFWVGGMAFAYFMLRPAAGALDPPVRLPLWRRVFQRFLPSVAIDIVLLLVTGYVMMFMMFGGFRTAPVYVHIMQGTGIAMMLLYLHLVFAPWKRFQASLDAGTLPEAARHLNQIRVIVAINLALGIITIAVATGGRLWGL
jgi:uncharacterized membrane protein